MTSRFKFDLVGIEEIPTVNTERGRYYRVPTGELYPSVTTVLSEQPEKKSILDKWRKRIGIEQAERISTKAAKRGTEMHSLMETYIIDECIPKDLMPTTRQIFNGLRYAVDNNLEAVLSIEASLYSHRLKLAGRADLIGQWGGVNAVIDYKTSAKVKREEWIRDYFIQATAYSIMFEELTSINVPNVVLLIGCDGETHPQVFVRQRHDYVQDLFRIVDEYHQRQRSGS